LKGRRKQEIIEILETNRGSVWMKGIFENYPWAEKYRLTIWRRLRKNATKRTDINKG